MIRPFDRKRMRKRALRGGQSWQPRPPQRTIWVEPTDGLWSRYPSTGAGKNAFFDSMLRAWGADFTRADLKPGEFIYITKDRKVHRSSE